MLEEAPDVGRWGMGFPQLANWSSAAGLWEKLLL